MTPTAVVLCACGHPASQHALNAEGQRVCIATSLTVPGLRNPGPIGRKPLTSAWLALCPCDSFTEGAVPA